MHLFTLVALLRKLNLNLLVIIPGKLSTSKIEDEEKVFFIVPYRFRSELGLRAGIEVGSGFVSEYFEK